jgi:hypothetical protein
MLLSAFPILNLTNNIFTISVRNVRFLSRNIILITRYDLNVHKAYTNECVHGWCETKAEENENKYNRRYLDNT